MRLDKYLTECGIGSRSEVKKILKNKEISVNGKVVMSPKVNIEKTDNIKYRNETIIYKEYRYYVINKPSGCITATEDNKEKTIMDILPSWVIQKKLFPVGRLDKDTEGLLLLTNDGVLAHKLLSPKKHVEKVYYVIGKKEISDEDMSRLENGIDIGGYITKKANCERVSNNEINLTITEGRYHQVKKMLHGINNEVVYLKRIKFANLTLKDLKVGAVVEIGKKEITNYEV